MKFLSAITIVSYCLLCFLQLLKAAYKLFLLACCQSVTNTRPSAVEELPSHRSDATLYLSLKDLIGELLEAVLQPCELRGRTATATTLATFGVTAAPDICVVRVVRYAVLVATNSLCSAASTIGTNARTNAHSLYLSPASFASSATVLFTLLPSSSVLPPVGCRQMFAITNKKETASRCEVPRSFGPVKTGVEDETLVGHALISSSGRPASASLRIASFISALCSGVSSGKASSADASSPIGTNFWP